MKNKIKSFCSNCHKETWHEILFEKGYQDTEHEKDYYHCSKSVVTECCGCEQPHYFWSSWTKNEDDPEIDSFSEWVFPPKSIRQPPSWYIDFAFSTVFDDDGKKHVSGLLREVHTALENNCPRLGIMGVRALLEHIMISKIGDHKSFKKNLQEFQSKGYISKIQHEAVVHILQAGHAAIHRSHTPSQGELFAALDIIEGLIETIYINPGKSLWISSNIRKRR